MSGAVEQLDATPNAELPTWFGIGGRADMLVRAHSIEDIRVSLDRDPDMSVLGDGANLLVDDEGVGGVVLSLQTDSFCSVDWDRGHARIYAGSGASLPKLIGASATRGLGGIQGLAGIPASVGGAVVMNAGGRFGEIGDAVVAVHAIDRAGRAHVFERSQIDFEYRRSGLAHLIVTGVEFQLTPGDPADLKAERLRAMAYKKQTQPLADKSAGCCFKNPILSDAIEGIGQAGARVSAGLLLDRAGCKGDSVGGATVSSAHANFVVTTPDARARDVIGLMDQSAKRVLDVFGVMLEREVVVWARRP